MRRPFSSKRPIGPVMEMGAEDDNAAEVNVYFRMKNLSDVTVDQVSEAIEDMTAFDGPVRGLFGRDNVVSFETRDNTTTHSNIMELEQTIETETGLDVEEVEVIW